MKVENAFWCHLICNSMVSNTHIVLADTGHIIFWCQQNQAIFGAIVQACSDKNSILFPSPGRSKVKPEPKACHWNCPKGCASSSLSWWETTKTLLPLDTSKVQLGTWTSWFPSHMPLFLPGLIFFPASLICSTSKQSDSHVWFNRIWHVQFRNVCTGQFGVL